MFDLDTCKQASFTVPSQLRTQALAENLLANTADDTDEGANEYPMAP